MLTNQFKAAVAATTGIVILGGVVFNQVSLKKQIDDVSLAQKTQIITLPSLTPVASPTAQLSPTNPIILPTKPVVLSPTVAK